MEFEINDYEQCSKLINSIAGKEYRKYLSRVSYSKLDKEDFVQNGWVAMMDCINKGINDLNYICVSIRNAMYRGVKKTAIIQTTNEQELWFYISGHNLQLEDKVSGTESEYIDVIPLEDKSLEESVIDRVLIRQILEELRESDKMELIRLMLELPPYKRKGRELSKKRAKQVLDGKQPYKNNKTVKQSEIIGVTYDKSKDRWVFSKRVDGKVRKFISNKDKRIVEEYALKYYQAKNA